MTRRQASAAQLAKTEEEVRRRQRELQDREAEVERYRQESERQRAELLNAARNEARELLANTNREATQELREAEAKGSRLLEQSRHQATELTNSARAEVEQTLEWARAQAAAILSRAQNGAEQLLAAAGLADEEIKKVGDAIVEAAQRVGARRAAAPRPAARGRRRQSPRRPCHPLPGLRRPRTSSGGSEPADESQDEQQP